jgi:hypothetical protein
MEQITGRHFVSAASQHNSRLYLCVTNTSLLDLSPDLSSAALLRNQVVSALHSLMICTLTAALASSQKLHQSKLTIPEVMSETRLLCGVQCVSIYRPILQRGLKAVALCSRKDMPESAALTSVTPDL